MNVTTSTQSSCEIFGLTAQGDGDTIGGKPVGPNDTIPVLLKKVEINTPNTPIELASRFGVVDKDGITRDLMSLFQRVDSDKKPGLVTAKLRCAAGQAFILKVQNPLLFYNRLEYGDPHR